MRTVLSALALSLLAVVSSAADRVVLLHFSDYHSHAVPFFSERGPSQGGIARAIGYLEREKKRGALVFSGGDMMNKGAPSWSDKYGCAEWPWLNGIVSAMALGNHDSDYGPEAFSECRKAIRYPILSANTAGFEGSRVFKAGGRRIGVFAVAGPDFPRLVKAPGLKFDDPIAAARRSVAELKAQNVDAVVMIGHQQTEDDYAIARAVPGIDLIFGTHAHLTRDLTQIPETRTWFISGGQYLEAISRVEIAFAAGGELSISGRLVAVDANLPESTKVAALVSKMQRELEADPQYEKMFRTVATLPRALTMADLAALTLDVMKSAAGADVALSTVSSFRGPLEAGEVTLEELTAAVPYDNDLVVCTMTAADVSRLVREASGREGDSRAYVRGSVGSSSESEGASYRVATTDYMARAYGSLFPCQMKPSGLKVREALLGELAKGRMPASGR